MNYKNSVIDSQKELNILSLNKEDIIVKAKYGPSIATSIPLYNNEGLTFFVAAIIGDGHLTKGRYRTSIECSDNLLMIYLKRICKDLFRRNFYVKKRKIRQGRKQTYVLTIDNKAIYNFLKNVFRIPPGKKSNIVIIPECIIKSKYSIKMAFLAGIMATEGGRRKRGFGLSTSSKQLWKDLIYLFNSVEIEVLKDKWIYKKYKKEYYGISFKKEYLQLIVRGCRSGQTGQILSKFR
tara:strand:- start:1623 stop:2330 length:708 start_codon:yes stop_codon:yes gene_type:complete